MRWILPLGCVLVVAGILCGCLQSSAEPPAVLSVSPTDVMVPDTTATPHPPAAVNVTATETQDSVVIRIDGGTDAAALASLSIRIMNYDGTSIQRTIPAPETGRDYSIQYFHTANARTINVVGTFADGYQQTLLITSL